MADQVKVWDENGQEQDANQAEKWDSWEKCKEDKRFPKGLIQFLEHPSGCNFPAPTPIQAHSWPTLCGGRDLIGIAKTGSGKTLAFLLPGFMWLKKNKKSDSPVDCQVGPAILVMTPTRELCNQIYEDAAKFGKPVQISAACAYGGAGKQEQALRMKDGPETLIATPGRLNDFVQNNVVNMDMVRYCVLDEADRMLDMGFEPQIKEILDRVQKDGRQMAMFTATWNKECREIANNYINTPLHVQIGHDDMAANSDISQHIKVVSDESAKKAELDKILGYLTEKGNCLVFCNSKKKVKDLTWELGEQAVELHGDLDQWRRDEALFKFRNGEAKVLVATDLASRGLDIRRVSIVVNYDAPKSAQDYVHRIGRTGRAGDAGDAFTFLSEWGQEKEALYIKQVMEQVGQDVPEELSSMAGQAQEEWKDESKDDNWDNWKKDDSDSKDKDWKKEEEKDWKKDDWNKSEEWKKEEEKDWKKDDWNKSEEWKKDDEKDWKKDDWNKKDDKTWQQDKDKGWNKDDTDWKKDSDDKTWGTDNKGWNEQEETQGDKADQGHKAQKPLVFSEEEMFDQLWGKLSDGCSRIGEQILFDLVKQVHGSKSTAPEDTWYTQEQFGQLCEKYEADPQEGLSKEQLLEVYRSDYDKLFCLKDHFATVVLEDAGADLQVSPANASNAPDMEVDAAGDAENGAAKRKADDAPVPSSAPKLARKAPTIKAASEYAELEQMLQDGQGDKLKVAQLKEWLTFKGLPATGLKTALVERATKALQ